MSETLSALIAFVGFLILFSMIVQSAQEAVKNILKLKVGIWERFFINLYSKETKFDMGKISYLSRLRMYVKRIWKGDFDGEFDKGFDRLREMLVTADNRLEDLKKSLQNIVGLDPVAADTPQLISNGLQPVLEAITCLKGLALSKALYIYVDVFKKEDLKNLYDQIKDFEFQHARIGNILQSSPNGPVADFQKTCKNLLRAIESVEDQNIESLEDRISRYRIQIEQNIDSWISQINEEYRKNMLKWTVVIGFIFVIIANADSFSIYRYLRSDTRLQATIAEKVKDVKVVKQTTDPEDLNNILVELKKNNLRDAKELSVSFLTRLENDYRTYDASTEAEKVKRLKESFEKIDINKKEESRKLQEEYDKIASFYVRLSRVAIDNQMQGLTELDLPLGWTLDCKKYEELKAKKNAVGATEDASKEYRRFVLQKIGGLILTAVLITFGAPFWNDILKALIGFRNAAKGR